MQALIVASGANSRWLNVPGEALLALTSITTLALTLTLTLALCADADPNCDLDPYPNPTCHCDSNHIPHRTLTLTVNRTLCAHHIHD